jgi:outer membrane protein assembly factor BamD
MRYWLILRVLSRQALGYYNVTPKSGLQSSGLRLAGIALLIALSLLAGCSTRGSARDLSRQNVETLYTNARKALDNNDYEYGIKLYEALTARFPFSTQARQARLDLIYIYYRKGEKESASDAADQFLRENPTHPRCDYAWYMKGLINFERVPYRVERWLGVDMARRPPSDVESAVTAFGTVVQKYPKSEYAHDARRRMVYLRNRLAEYEINVANYYIKRGAYLAAAQRAQRAIEQYDGAPATREAVAVMIECYGRLGLTELRDNAQKVYDINYPADRGKSRVSKSWWRLW